jgi:hypothetical protein
LGSNNLANFIRFKAGSADSNSFDIVANVGTDLLQIRIKTPLRGIQRVAAMIANLGLFSTYIAYS